MQRDLTEHLGFGLTVTEKGVGARVDTFVTNDNNREEWPREGL